MKKIKHIIAIILISAVFNAEAQKINNIDLLKSELQRIKKEKLRINSVDVNQNGNWIILYGDIGYSFMTIPEKLEKKLDSLNKKQIPVKDIDFVGKSGWLLLAANNAFYSDSLPEKLVYSLKKINKQGKKITCFANYDKKGILIYDKNNYYQKNIPETLKKKLNELKTRNQQIKNTALDKNNAWVILYADRGFAYSGIPLALSQKLKETVQNGSSLNGVFFLGDKWILVYDDYKYISNL